MKQSLRVVCFAMAALVLVGCDVVGATYCCPKCTANTGQCYVSNEVYGFYTKGGDCLNACPGSCVKAAKGSYVCGLEPCGPLTCPSAATEAAFLVDDEEDGARARQLRGRQLSAAVGTCLPGRNQSGMPLLNLDDRWWGSYSYHVNMAHNKAREEQIRVVDHWTSNPVTSGFQVSNGGNTMYWPVKNAANVWQLHARNDEYVTFNFSLGSAVYARVFAASDDVIFTFDKVPATNILHFLAYDARHPPSTLISNVTMKNTAPNGELPTVYAFQRNVYVLMGTQLYMWDAFLPHQVRNVTITVSDCNIAGTKDQADALKSAAVRNGLFMFTAFKRFGPKSVQLCATNVETGETGPLMPSLPDYPRSYDSLEVEFFDNAVLYTSAGGTVSMGDPVVCIISSAAAAGKSKCYWLTNILQHDVDYEFTKLYSNYHMPSNPDGVAQWTIYKDVVVYRAYAEVFTYSYFGYNLTSQEVYPVALVYGVPNTDCFHFTGDGSTSYSTHSFMNAWMLTNGTVLLLDQYTTLVNPTQQNAIVHVTSPLLRGDVVGCNGGCSLHGGTCINGQCYCQPGCSGSDCRSGQPYCDPAPPAQDDDF